jgi:hypothetical protein
MSLYPSTIARCQHIKVNGTQCGSPALKSRRLCFFHNRWREARIEFCQSGAPAQAITSIDLPVLEDANSVQVAIMQVLRLILAKQLEPKIAGLLLYGLQTASLNLKQAKFEPFFQTDVVIEPRNVGDTLLGGHVWDPREYQPDEYEEEDEEEPGAAAPNELAVAAAGTNEAGINEAEINEENPGEVKTDEAKPDQEKLDDAIRAQPAGKEKLLATPAKAQARASSSEPSLATLLATLVKLEQMQKRR